MYVDYTFPYVKFDFNFFNLILQALVNSKNYTYIPILANEEKTFSSTNELLDLTKIL